MNQLRPYVLFLFVLTILIGACRHDPDAVENTNNAGGGPDTLIIINPDPCNSDSVYFVNTIQPLLASMCATEDCHDAVYPQEGVQLTDYTHIMEQVEPYDITGSDLWDKGIFDADEPMPPADAPQLTQEEINLIAQWINQGARNNSCQEDCNPEEFSYSQNLAPMIDLYCVGCHAGINPSGGFALGTYEQLVNTVESTNFMDVLNGSNGLPVMPPNTTGLPDCYKSQFQSWIDAGMPNN